MKIQKDGFETWRTGQSRKPYMLPKIWGLPKLSQQITLFSRTHYYVLISTIYDMERLEGAESIVQTDDAPSLKRCSSTLLFDIVDLVEPHNLF